MEYISTGGITSLIPTSFTRPANTTPYTALDVVSNSTSAPTLLTFENMGYYPEHSGYITKARILTNQSTNTARFRLHLYHTAPTAINDNSPYTLLYANKEKRIGAIDFGVCGTEGSGSDAASAMNATLRLAYNCAEGSTNLYGILETLDAFTPASGQQFYIELACEQN